MQKALGLSMRLEAGTVHVNDTTISDEPHVPFGGVGNSGFGREGGRCSLEEPTEVKWLTLQMAKRRFPSRGRFARRLQGQGDRTAMEDIAGQSAPRNVERWFTEPTTAYWQDLLPCWPTGPEAEPPFRYGFPVRLPDGRALVLPIRELPNGEGAVASLIANQASLAVVRALATFMGDAARDLGAEIIVGLPTLGLALAPRVAETLGHSRYVPLGYSRKFWYEDALSEPVSSITSPGAGKRIFLDPNQDALLRGRRIVIVDDAVSTGTTLAAAARLLRRRSLDVAGAVVAMKQSLRWERTLSDIDPALPDRVSSVFACPRFRRAEDGWIPSE